MVFDQDGNYLYTKAAEEDTAQETKLVPDNVLQDTNNFLNDIKKRTYSLRPKVEMSKIH